MRLDDFYKYIIRRKNSFEIKKGNEKFGTYSRLADALYERDRLIESNWDWDDYLQLEETDNFYEHMELPPFFHDSSYIYKRPQTYVVIKDGMEYGKFNTKGSAYQYAEQIGGEVEPRNIIYLIRKRIDGLIYDFGSYKTLEEAKEVRDKLMASGWRK